MPFLNWPLSTHSSSSYRTALFYLFYFPPSNTEALAVSQMWCSLSYADIFYKLCPLHGISSPVSYSWQAPLKIILNNHPPYNMPWCTASCLLPGTLCMSPSSDLWKDNCMLPFLTHQMSKVYLSLDLYYLTLCLTDNRCSIGMQYEYLIPLSTVQVSDMLWFVLSIETLNPSLTDKWAQNVQTSSLIVI